MGKSIVHLDWTTLREILLLPEDCKVIAIGPDLQHRFLEILVESDTLPEVREGEPYPIGHVHYKVEFHPEDREFKKVSVRVEAYMPKGST